MDEWMSRLREQTDDVRPTNDAHGRVTEELGRRRRRRHRLVAVGAVVSVAAVVTVAVVVPQVLGRDDARDGEPATTEPPTVASTPPATDPSNLLPVFTCPLDNPVFTDEPPPIADLARQQQVADEVTRPPVGPDFHVNVARPTQFGVVALVTGDVEVARAALVPQGVALVYPYDPNGGDVGLDPDAQVDQVVQWQLDPVLGHAEEATRGIEGRAGFAYWPEAGAVLVQWQHPVPEEVRSLEDVHFKSGGQIIVRGVSYSAADVRQAQNALRDWLVESDWRDGWSSSSACGDFSGLVVGLTPESLADADIDVLQREIAEAIGMPAYVVPEERPVTDLAVPPED